MIINRKWLKKSADIVDPNNCFFTFIATGKRRKTLRIRFCFYTSDKTTPDVCDVESNDGVNGMLPAAMMPKTVEQLEFMLKYLRML